MRINYRGRLVLKPGIYNGEIRDGRLTFYDGFVSVPLPAPWFDGVHRAVTVQVHDTSLDVL